MFGSPDRKSTREIQGCEFYHKPDGKTKTRHHYLNGGYIASGNVQIIKPVGNIGVAMQAQSATGTLVAGELKAQDAPTVAHFHHRENVHANTNVVIIFVPVIADNVSDIPEDLDFTICQLVRNKLISGEGVFLGVGEPVLKPVHTLDVTSRRIYGYDGFGEEELTEIVKPLIRVRDLEVINDLVHVLCVISEGTIVVRDWTCESCE